MKKKLQDITIEQAKNLFIQNQLSKGISAKTIKNAEDSIAKFLLVSHIFPSEQIDHVKYITVQDFIMKLQSNYQSISTKNLYLSHLRVFLYWCMEQGYMEQFKIRLLKGQSSAIKFFTEEEVNKLLVQPKRDCSFYEDRTYTIICFIYSTGARANTVLNLKVKDLDFKNRTITYTHLKNKSVAIIPMSNSLYKILTKYLATWDIKEYLFPNGTNEQLSLTALETSLRRYCVKRGVKPRGPHSLRHAFARMYIKSGGDAFSLQKILTHSSMEMTRRYVNLFSEDLRESMNTYNPLDKIKSDDRVRRTA